MKNSKSFVSTDYHSYDLFVKAIVEFLNGFDPDTRFLVVKHVNKNNGRIYYELNWD